ncbi:MAG: UDP-N-acetylglucosamine 2-epimerase (non-hydrolyzing), partial [Hyphomicrobiaceae bacterium]|nr:UDP-N-acetylglucosamine 2-epimerase (non-hydrolyzing) [Hyphomicrobiaceae bacterium]
MTGAARQRIVSVVGARPQFVKAAAVSRAVAADGRLEEILIHTGQHFDANMSEIFFRELEIPRPAYELDIHGLDHGAMTGRMLEAIEHVLRDEQPAMVVVYGDTNSTLAGALAAAKLNVPVAHVEAGLRSFNRRMPEEINRVLADHVSTLLLCPTRQAIANLAREGVLRGVHHVGDVMYDATLFAREVARARSRILDTLHLAPGTFGVATVHRAENTDDEDRFRRILGYLEARARTRPIVFPVHPRTRAVMARLGAMPGGVRLIDPLGYHDLHRLLMDAAEVLTDSGGLQKEAYFHRVPCITLRDETEWVETVECGWNRLWTSEDYAARREIDEYGNGQAAAGIV